MTFGTNFSEFILHSSETTIRMASPHSAGIAVPGGGSSADSSSDAASAVAAVKSSAKSNTGDGGDGGADGLDGGEDEVAVL